MNRIYFNLFIMDNDKYQCSMCHKEFVIGDNVELLSCNHMYHLFCFRKLIDKCYKCNIILKKYNGKIFSVHYFMS